MNRALPSTSTSDPTATMSLGRWGTILALAASAAVALAGGTLLVDGRLATESRFLALLVGLVLVPAFSLPERGPGSEAWLAPLLAVVAAWSLPSPQRGAVVVALLVAGLFRTMLRVESWSFDRLVAAAIGVQVLLRSDLLLAEPGAVLVHWIVLPALAAAGVALLEGESDGRGLAAGVVVLCAAGGITPVAAAMLLASGMARWAGQRRWPARVGVVAGGLALGAVGSAPEWADWWSQAEVVLMLTAVVVLLGLDPDRQPPLVPSSESLAGKRWWGAVILVAAIVLPLLAATRPWGTVAKELSWLLLLLPFLAAGSGSFVRIGAGSGTALLSAVALAGVALRSLPPPQAMPAVVVIAVFALPRRWLTASIAWGTALMAGSALLAAYPWLRPMPLESLAGAIGLSPGWGLALGSALAATLWSRAPSFRRSLAWSLAGILILRLWLAGPWETLHRWPPIDLTQSSNSWSLEDIGSTTVELVLDTALANSASLPAGTEVGELRLESGLGRHDVRWPLRVGRETGEWAADRPDLHHIQTPSAWLSTVDASGTFFAHRYRAHLVLPEPMSAERLVIRRAPDLPPEVVLSVFHLARRTGGGREEDPAPDGGISPAGPAAEDRP